MKLSGHILWNFLDTFCETFWHIFVKLSYPSCELSDTFCETFWHIFVKLSDTWYETFWHIFVKLYKSTITWNGKHRYNTIHIRILLLVLHPNRLSGVRMRGFFCALINFLYFRWILCLCRLHFQARRSCLSPFKLVRVLPSDGLQIGSSKMLCVQCVMHLTRKYHTI